MPFNSYAPWTTSPIFYHLLIPGDLRLLLLVLIFLTTSYILLLEPQRSKIIPDFSSCVPSILFRVMAVHSYTPAIFFPSYRLVGLCICMLTYWWVIDFLDPSSCMNMLLPCVRCSSLLLRTSRSSCVCISSPICPCALWAGKYFLSSTPFPLHFPECHSFSNTFT